MYFKIISPHNRINFRTTAFVVAMLLLPIAFSTATFTRNALWHDSISLWKDAAVKSPGRGRPFHKLGAEFRARNDFGRAMFYYKKARLADPAYFDRQLAYQRRKLSSGRNPISPDEATGHGDSSVMTMLSLAEKYVQFGRRDEAVREYLKVLALNPRQPTILNDLGLIYYRRGLIVEAANYFTKALQVDPDYSVAYTNLGIIYYSQGRIDMALDHLRKAVKLDRRDSEAFIKLGLVCMAVGMRGEAKEALENALSIDPNNPAIRASLEEISLLKSLLKSGQ